MILIEASKPSLGEPHPEDEGKKMLTPGRRVFPALMQSHALSIRNPHERYYASEFFTLSDRVQMEDTNTVVAFHTQARDWSRLAPLFQPWVSQESVLLSQKAASAAS